jgi:hypothetical protein
MSMLTSTLISSTSARPAAAVPARPGLFSRIVKHMIEARRRQVERELHRHGLHLPSELEAAGRKINERNEDSLPFIR